MSEADHLLDTIVQVTLRLSSWDTFNAAEFPSNSCFIQLMHLQE